MLLPLSIAFFSVLAGTLLWLGGSRHTKALATFALVSALAVALGQLLPDALAAVGMPALLVFVAGAVFPSLLEKVGTLRGAESTGRWGLELGYAALLLHKVGDGIGLGTYGGGHHAEHAHLDVLFAIAAHTVPMVALVAVVFQRHFGRRSALLRVAGLGVAAMIGVGLPSLVPATAFDSFEPWITAAVAGLLIHVVAHDWHPEEKPTQPTGRMTDLLAVVAGVLMVVVSGQHSHHGGGAVRASMGEALLELTLETAPALLFGLVIGALLSALGSRLPTKWLRSGGAMRQALRGAVVGAPLPICACGVLPLAASLKRRGAGAALVVAFLISTPELGVETFALTTRFVGWPFALVRLGAAVALAIVAALVVHRAAGKRGEALDEPVVPVGASSAPFGTRFLQSFDELLHHIAPWTVVGLVAAAYMQAVLPSDALDGGRAFGLDVALVTLVAVPSYVCAASATPLAAVLLAKGMSPGAVLVGLLLGPATNLATVGFLRKSYGTRATVFGAAALVGGAWIAAALVNVSSLPIALPTAEALEHAHGWGAIVAAVLLALAVLRSIWRAGVRGWLGSLGESITGSDHDHDGSETEDLCCAHDHDHAHDHAHDHPHDHDQGPPPIAVRTGRD